MKRKILIAMLAAVAASAAVAAGCSVGPKKSDLAEDRGATAHVIYNANGGEFETKQGIKDLFYEPNAPILNIGEVRLDRITLSYTGYKFLGWYFAETDADGNVLYEDEEKTVVKLGEAVTFPYRIQDEEELYVYAKWVLDKVVEIRLVSDTAVTADVEVEDEEGNVTTEEKTFNSGDILSTRSFGADTAIYVRDESPVEAKGSTFVSYYEDEACTKPFGGEITKPGDDEEGNAVLYAKFVAGSWRILKSRSDVTSMFSLGIGMSSYNYYLAGDIDCQNSNFTSANTTACTIQGNGYRLYNMRFTATRISNGEYSPFGTISSTAKISNLTLENVTVSYSTMPNTIVNGLYLVCAGMENGASIENLKIKSANLEVEDAERSCTIANLTNANGGYFTDKWMFGGEGTDAEFLAANSGITVEDCTLSVNDVKQA